MTDTPLDFRAVYDAHFDFVWRVLRRLGVREADALDLTQKVFLTVHVRLETFEGRSLLRTWIFGICQRLASDYRRSARIRREVTTDVTEIDAQRDERDGPLATMESRQRAVFAEAILDKLPEAQRIVFVLFELEEMSGDEIAALLDVSVGTVRSRLRLAREAVRREVSRLAAKTSTTRKAALG
ncbi:MAG TPA: RNA polymerase sigma factor [Polyangiaceae bacterium]|nr:RNA polymerase sigma factor [Polyangiaceae bacterium]